MGKTFDPGSMSQIPLKKPPVNTLPSLSILMELPLMKLLFPNDRAHMKSPKLFSFKVNASSYPKETRLEVPLMLGSKSVVSLK